MNITDIIIHIKESLNETARTDLENTLRKVDGVVSPRFNAGKEHLFMVAFDPDKIKATDLLGKTRAAGYTAQLISM